MQATAVYAKPTSIYFYSPDDEWTIDGTTPIYDESGTQVATEVELSGNLRMSGTPGTWATFTCLDTVRYFYDKDGVQK